MLHMDWKCTRSILNYKVQKFVQAKLKDGDEYSYIRTWDTRKNNTCCVSLATRRGGLV